MLERRLLERRLAALEPRTRAVVLALALLVSGFAYWQVRVPLDGACRAGGGLGGAVWLSGVLAALAVAAAAIAATRQSAIAARVPGPEWLALPVSPSRVARHLLSEARLPALAMFPPALAALAAGAGLVPLPWLGLLAAGFVLAWLEGTRAAAALARRLAVRHARGGHGLPAEARVLLAARQSRPEPPLAAPRWRRETAWRAIVRLDFLTTRRASAARARALFALAFLALGALAWFTAASPVQRRALAFAAYLPACAALGGWAIARTCSDPASALRALPLGPRDLWLARFLAIAGVLVAALAGNAALAGSLPPGARIALLFTWWAPGAAIAALGLHYALTLYPRAQAAESLYFGWLGVALAGSIMIPFLGWGVLLAGLIHSAMRLPRWWSPEVD